MKRWLIIFALAFVAADLATDVPSAEAAPKRGRRRSRPKPKPAPPAESAPAPAQGSFRGPTRIDFDDRLIQGQTNKSGAVYLFDRKETGITSMVKRRKSFLRLTIQTVYDR